ncbi:hypothetical protein LCL87_14905 [Rhodococcus hoagii]|nr:hypothetical protein [Prescottella equi]
MQSPAKENEVFAVVAAVAPLSVAGIVVCLLALDKSGWRVQLGDLGTWVGGIGSAAAAFAAFVTLRQLLKTNRQERNEMRDRALRRAKRVTLKVDMKAGLWTAVVANQSGHPIYDPVWRGFVSIDPDTESSEFFKEPPQPVSLPTVIFNEGSQTLYQQRTGAFLNGDKPEKMVPDIEFTDDDGYRFRRSLTPNGVGSSWTHVD